MTPSLKSSALSHTLQIMTLPDIETEALELPRSERARLAEALLESLDELSDEENERLSIEEARRRDRDLNDGAQSEKPAAEVFRQLRAKVR